MLDASIVVYALARDMRKILVAFSVPDAAYQNVTKHKVQLMTSTYSAIFAEDNGRIVGWVNELPGAIAQERTLDVDTSVWLSTWL